jgi:hypothetical protein
MGFPDPAVSTGLVHQLLSALPNMIGIAVRAPDLYASATAGSRYRSPLVISAQITRAILFARATAAALVAGRRLSQVGGGEPSTTSKAESPLSERTQFQTSSRKVSRAQVSGAIPHLRAFASLMQVDLRHVGLPSGAG